VQSYRRGGIMNDEELTDAEFAELDDYLERMHDIIDAAKLAMTGFSEKSCSKNTADAYGHDFRRCKATGSWQENGTKHVRTYDRKRAACAWYSRVLIDDWINHDYDAFIQGHTYEKARDLKYLEELTKIAQRYPKKPKDSSKNVQVSALRESLRSQTKRDPKRYKRGDVKLLTDDTLRAFWGSAQRQDDAALIAVIMLAGVRPVELEGSGVSVTRTSTGHIVLDITGAKQGIKGLNGQPWRKITFDLRSEPAQYLYGLHGTQTISVQTAKSALFAKRFTALAKKIWPESTSGVTALTFRHWAGSRFKLAFEDTSTVASGMGHRSDGTQQHYGLKSQIRSGPTWTPISAEAAEPVRIREQWRDYTNRIQKNSSTPQPF
jgi:integrase